VELKPSYYRQGVKNLDEVAAHGLRNDDSQEVMDFAMAADDEPSDD
jgi:hypothetical protein